MLNSFTVFAAFISFIIFGYASVIRLVSKRHSRGKSSFLLGLVQGVKSVSFLSNLGCSAFFIALPATALLLFWGWGPALLWLAAFHLLIESVFHVQYSSQQNDLQIADHLLRSETGLKATLEQGLIQVFFLLSIAVVVALVATLLDRQPGLLFALLFLLPARALISHPSKSLPMTVRGLGAMALLAVGLAFSDQLGFSVYGDWAPFGSHIPWLVFNMPTLIAAILVVSVFKLEGNQGFKQDLSVFSGLIIVILVVTMAVKLAWIRPILDAPLNSGSLTDETRPIFAFIGFFLFTGFTAFLIRILNEEENQSQHDGTQLGRLQSGSLVHTVYMALLVLSLASALGIGAWKTHYLDWSDSMNILNYLNLAISSNLNLIYADANSGTILHTILLAALCFTGFSFLLMCANQLSLEEAENESMMSLIIEAKIPQAVGIFIVSAYFIGNGINIDTWVLIGILAWVLCSHFLLGLCLHGQHSILFSGMVFLVIALGTLQLLYFFLLWLLAGQFLLVTLTLAIITIAAGLWYRDIIYLAQRASSSTESEFL